MDFYFLLFVGVGLYAIAGAILNREWFMDDPKAQVFVRLLGRTGTRVFYTLLGAGLVVLGFLGFFDLLG